MKLYPWLSVICNMSVTASAVILVILPARLLLKKMPKVFSYLLWSVVLFRLLCPVSISSQFSVLGVLGETVTEKADMEYIPVEFINTDDWASTDKGAGDESNAEFLTDSKKASAIDTELSDIIAYIWMLGVGGMLCFNGINLYRLKKKIVGAVCIEGDKGEDTFLHDGLMSVGCTDKNSVICRRQRRKVRIYESDYITSPFVIGLFHPRIYVPTLLTEQERYFILLHEKIHIKRGDHIAKLLFFVALTIHWFNPLVWLAFYLAEKDMEMSCDERVIKRIDGDIRADYSKTLLHLASGRKIAAGIPLGFGAGDIKERITNIMRCRKPAIIIMALTVAALSALIFVLGSNPKGNAQGKDNAVSKEISRQDAERTTENIRNSDAEDGVPDVSPDAVAKDNIFHLSVRSISKSLRGIDSYVPEEGLADYMESVGKSGGNSNGGDMEDVSLVFSDDCVFKINQSMTGIEYKTVSFDDFAQCINESNHSIVKLCVLKFSDGLITEIYLQSAYYRYGITSSIVADTRDEYREHQKIAGKDFLEQYYTLGYSGREDIVDMEDMETIEVYTGNMGDGESGYVLIKDKDGTIIHNEFAHTARAGWNSIYIGKIGDKNFLLTLHIENRDTYGSYDYMVFRLGKQGGVKPIAGSCFEFGEPYEYNKKLFRKWTSGLQYYLKASTLLLSTQDGEVRTEPVSEADRYNFQTLQPLLSKM